jgi:hypothetical protein
MIGPKQKRRNVFLEDKTQQKGGFLTKIIEYRLDREQIMKVLVK